MMNDLFNDKIGYFVLVYLDDIVIYSKTIDDHWKHVRAVLQVLREKKLYCNLKKSQFAKREISYLGHIISDKGVSMDRRKFFFSKDMTALSPYTRCRISLLHTRGCASLLSKCTLLPCSLAVLRRRRLG